MGFSFPSSSPLSFDGSGSGTTPSLYLVIIVTERLKRLPKSLARSLFILPSKAASEKSPSRPKGTSLKRKYLKASTPYFSITSTGSTTLPLDLLILAPSTVHQPWAKTLFGRGRPAESKKAGQ